MTSVSVTAGETITAAQYILMMLQTYTGYGDYLCPPTSMTVTADTAAATTYDYIVVGAGTAGSVMTYRLSECTNKTTLLIEDGPCAPLESLSPGLFTMLPQSVYDRNYTFVNDSYSCQNQQPQGGPTAAYMFGGTGALNHMIHVRACDADLNRWCAAANDSSWCADEMNKYMAKSEALFDSSVSDQNSYVHGTDGCVGLTRQTSSYIDFVLEGANELDIPTTNDTLPASAKYANFPLLAIANGTRTYGNAGCLKETLTRTNVKYLAGHVNKVNFDGTVATGVQVTVSGVTYNITAGKVIMTTGALQTPIVQNSSSITAKTQINEFSSFALEGSRVYNRSTEA